MYLPLLFQRRLQGSEGLVQQNIQGEIRTLQSPQPLPQHLVYAKEEPKAQKDEISSLSED